MSFTFYLALTLTNIRNQVARPTSRASVPASQLAKQPAGRPAKTLANWRYSQPSAGRPAGQKTTPMQRYPAGRPAGRSSYTRLAGRPAGINTDWPAGRARNSRPSSPRSLIYIICICIYIYTIICYITNLSKCVYIYIDNITHTWITELTPGIHQRSFFRQSKWLVTTTDRILDQHSCLRIESLNPMSKTRHEIGAISAAISCDSHGLN